MRQKVWRQFTCLSVAHGLMCAVLLPVMALQGSSSLWHHREQWLQIGPNIGSLLLSALFLLAAGMSLPSTRLIRRFGYAPLLVGNCLAVTLFLLSHLYASIYTLLPAYLLLGFTLSASNSCKAALIVHYGGRLSCSQHSEQCSTLVAAQQALTQQTGSDALHEEHKMFCNRDQKVRRLARWFRAAQDIGMIVGASLASLLLACNANDWSCSTAGNEWNGTVPTNWPQPEDFYGRNEHGERICGADMCPLPEAAALPWITTNHNHNNNNNITRSIFTEFIESSSRAGGQSMLWLYVLLSLVALLVSLLQGRQVGTTGAGRQDRERDRDRTAKDVTETLLFAGPLSYFVGTEQGYMLGDFLRAFVSCSLGIGMIAGALIGMGLMQLIVSCTLSMLLRHTKRIVVICEYQGLGSIHWSTSSSYFLLLPPAVAGFFFHSCLLLALSSWKPSSDDSALFYVIAASWGACNGMWETLLLSLVTLNHVKHDHVTDVTAPLQALRFLGLSITFAAHGFLCESSKIIALVVLLVISVPPYAMLEMRLEAQRKATLISL